MLKHDRPVYVREITHKESRMYWGTVHTQLIATQAISTSISVFLVHKCDACSSTYIITLLRGRMRHSRLAEVRTYSKCRIIIQTMGRPLYFCRGPYHLWNVFVRDFLNRMDLSSNIPNSYFSSVSLSWYSYAVDDIVASLPLKSIGGPAKKKDFVHFYICCSLIFLLSKMGSYVSQLSLLFVLQALSWSRYYEI